MRGLTVSDHVYSVLAALVITAVAIPFNPGIPWFAWVGAFALLLLIAELVSVFLKVDGQSAHQVRQQSRQRTVLYFSAVAATILILVLVGYLIW